MLGRLGRLPGRGDEKACQQTWQHGCREECMSGVDEEYSMKKSKGSRDEGVKGKGGGRVKTL